MKFYQNKNTVWRLAIILPMFFVFLQTATAQQLKPKEIIYSRLPTDLNSAPTDANSPTIWAVGQDGGGDRQIAVGMEPRISDDGRYLLFRRIVAAAGDVFHYNPYASQAQGQLWVRDLMNNSETMIFDFTINSRRLIGYYFSPFSNQGNYQIILDYGTLFYKMNLDGTGAVAIDPYSGGGVPREGDNFPVLRRGDSLLAANNRDRQDFGLVTRTLGSEPAFDVPNTNGSDYNPSWSNDNQFVGLTTIRSQNCFNLDTSANGCNYPYFFNKISKIKPDGNGRAQLADLSGTNTNGIAYGTVWTEDNTKIITAARIGGVAGLYIFKTDGSGTYTRIPLVNGNTPDFVGGIVQPRTDAQAITNGGGLITDQNGNFAAKEDGLIEADITQVNQFSLVDTIGEPIAGDAMTGGSFTFKSGFVPNTPANIAGGNGSEGDVAGRPNGDGQILSNDVVGVQRFQIGLDQPFQSNEFQRADAAPFLGGGDGQILANDVIQVQRYQIGLDQAQNAVGPVDFGSSRQSEPAEKSVEIAAAPRQLSVENASGSGGQAITVNVRADALGDEAAYGFTLNYNSLIMTATSAQIGTAGGSRLCNLTVAGQVRCSIINFPDDLPGSDTDQIGEIHAGNNQLLMKINFTVTANAPGGTYSLTISGVNASNDLAQNLTISGQSGMLVVSGPTAADSSASGRVLTADGSGIQSATVTVIAQTGATRGTLTDKFGKFKFDNLESGENYIFRVAAKRFTFSQDTKVVAVGETTDGIDFVADGKIAPPKYENGLPKR